MNINNITQNQNENKIQFFQPSSSSSSNPPSASSTSSSSSSSMRKGLKITSRVHRACAYCRKMKMRCEGPINGPCNRCQSTGQPCVFEKPKEKKKSTNLIHNPTLELIMERLNTLEREIRIIQNCLKDHHLRQSPCNSISSSTINAMGSIEEGTNQLTTLMQSSFGLPSSDNGNSYSNYFGETLTSSYDHLPFQRMTTKSKSMTNLRNSISQDHTPVVPLVPSNYFPSSSSNKKRSHQQQQVSQNGSETEALMTTVSEVMQAVLQNCNNDQQQSNLLGFPKSGGNTNVVSTIANHVPARTAPIMPSLQCESVNILPTVNKESNSTLIQSSPISISQSIIPSCSSTNAVFSTTSQSLVDSGQFNADQLMQVSQICSNSNLSTTSTTNLSDRQIFSNGNGFVNQNCSQPSTNFNMNSVRHPQEIEQNLNVFSSRQQQQQIEDLFSTSIEQICLTSDQMDLVSSGILSSAIGTNDFSRTQSQPMIMPGTILTHLPFFPK